jgi:hypothetical protein
VEELLSQLLNVQRVNDVRQIEVHTADPLVPDPSIFEVEIATAKLKKYKFPGSDQIPAELIQAGVETLQSEIYKRINSIWSKEQCMISGRSLLCYKFTKMAINQTVVIIEEYHCYQLYAKLYPMYLSEVMSILRRNYWRSSVWVST